MGPLLATGRPGRSGHASAHAATADERECHITANFSTDPAVTRADDPFEVDDAPTATGTNPGSIGMRPTFEQFFTTERTRLISLLTMRLGNLDLAIDAVDVAMGRAWQRWHRLDDPAPWIYRVAMNWATSWLRRRRRISRSPVPDQPRPGPAPDPQPEVTAALERLSDDHRAVISLRIHAGYSVKQAATALDIPEGTVMSRLKRALDQLRDDLEADA